MNDEERSEFSDLHDSLNRVSNDSWSNAQNTKSVLGERSASVACDLHVDHIDWLVHQHPEVVNQMPKDITLRGPIVQPRIATSIKTTSWPVAISVEDGIYGI